MAKIDRMDALGAVGREFDEAMAVAEQEEQAAKEIALAVASEEEVKPQIFARLHGPAPSGKRIVQLPPWYPGEWLLPRLRHPIRTVLGWFSLPPKAWALFRVLTGGIVRGEAYQARNEACDKCPLRQVWITGRKTKDYCGACGCARWWLSQLRIKNHLRKWVCPIRKWDEAAGPYPDARLRTVIVELGYASEDDLRPSSGGCGSCSGANKNGQARRMDQAAVNELAGG